jgi:stage IV sporulation protein FB
VLAEPDRTNYDLNFRLFGFRVRVHPLFWLGAALLGMRSLKDGLEYLLIWVGVVFVSIIVHELGHALAFRRFGTDAHIVLWMFGGLAVPYSGVAGRGRRIVVSLAGPAAGFVLCGIVYGTQREFGWANGNEYLALMCIWLVVVNLYWGILNLLPVFPLDGGQVSRELCEAKWRGRGVVTSLKISVSVAATVAAYSLFCEVDARSGNGVLGLVPYWLRGDLFTAILFGLLAYQSYQLLQFHTGGYHFEPADDRVPWER